MIEQTIHLDMVAVHFSTRCGAACSFCYFSDPLTERLVPTPIHDIEKILKKLALEEVSEVLFVGGDPVVHPQFLESLKIAKGLGLVTSVLSNSWVIRPVRQFDEALALIDNCEATFLAADPAAHDNLTQRPGSYHRLVENLERIAASGKRIGVCANATPQNLSQIYSIVANLERLYRVPVKSLMIQRIIPSGAASGEFRFGLNLADVDLLMRQIDQVVSEFGIPILFEDPVPWCTVDPKYHKYLARCEWGYTRGSINSNGQLNRCGADDHSRLGSIWDGHIQELWRRHPVLQSFRSKAYLPDECQTCPLLEKCGGGCPLSCGTLKDHDVDQLYIQRIQLRQKGVYTPSAPSGQGVGPDTVRYAYRGDLNRIVSLEKEIFGDSGPLLTESTIERLFDRCPKAFTVATLKDVVVGYAVVYPLTAAGVEEVLVRRVESIIDLPVELLGERLSGASGVFLEVIAMRSDVPHRLRFSLVRNAIDTIDECHGPAFTCAISTQGLELAQRFGFVPANEEGLHALYVREPSGRRGSRAVLAE